MRMLALCGLLIIATASPVLADAGADEARELGEAVLRLQAALADPTAPDAMEAVTALGLDSRYYVMVRGWLVQELSGVRSIEAARSETPDPYITARREFLEAAIRRIDLE